MTGTRTTSLSRLGRLTLKELRETLRDRRTIITLVLMPILVYPLLGATFQKFFLAQFAAQEPTEYHVAFDSMESAIRFRDVFSEGNQLLGKELNPGTPISQPLGSLPEPSLKLIYPQGNETFSLEVLVASHQADIGVRLQAPAQASERRYQFVTRRGSVLGKEAREFLELRLRAVNDAFVESYFRNRANGQRLPLSWEEASVEGPPVSDFSLATLVPLVLILMTVTGAVYPAIDLTAGERERGTLEALIAAPINRRELLIAKYVAVVAVASLTAVVNLTAMVATAYGTGLEQTLFGSAGLSITLMLQIFGLLAVFAGFFSAVILCITSIARSFKEAQAYLIPVMLLSLAPGILALMPGLEMTPLLALTPLVNMVVLTRDLLDGNANGAWVLMALGSSLAYAVVALTLAARIFGTDAVLYGSAGTWGELFKRPTTMLSTPTLSHGMIALGLLFPAYILFGGLPARLSDWSLSGRLGVSAGLTIVLFAGWPLLLAGFARVKLATGFGLVKSSGWSFAGAALAGLSLWPFAYELEIWTVSAERLRALVELFRDLELDLQGIPVVWKLTTLALVPALCEELFFRGFLFRAVRSSLRAATSILLTAVLFGLFHVLVRDALLLERFLPTALMGLVLGSIAYRSGSVLPGMCLHVIHNGGLLLLPLWGPKFGWLASTEARSHLPWPVLLTAGICVVVAGLLIGKSPPPGEFRP